MFSIFFYTDVVSYGSTNFEYIFYSGATILTFITPILTGIFEITSGISAISTITVKNISLK